MKPAPSKGSKFQKDCPSWYQFMPSIMTQSFGRSQRGLIRRGAKMTSKCSCLVFFRARSYQNEKSPNYYFIIFFRLIPAFMNNWGSFTYCHDGHFDLFDLFKEISFCKFCLRCWRKFPLFGKKLVLIPVDSLMLIGLQKRRKQNVLLMRSCLLVMVPEIALACDLLCWKLSWRWCDYWRSTI